MLFFLLNISPIVSVGKKKKIRKLLVGKINEYLIVHNSQNVLQYQLPRFVKSFWLEASVSESDDSSECLCLLPEFQCRAKQKKISRVYK